MLIRRERKRGRVSIKLRRPRWKSSNLILRILKPMVRKDKMRIAQGNQLISRIKTAALWITVNSRLKEICHLIKTKQDLEVFLTMLKRTVSSVTLKPKTAKIWQKTKFKHQLKLRTITTLQITIMILNMMSKQMEKWIKTKNMELRLGLTRMPKNSEVTRKIMINSILKTLK